MTLSSREDSFFSNVHGSGFYVSGSDGFFFNVHGSFFNVHGFCVNVQPRAPFERRERRLSAARSEIYLGFAARAEIHTRY